MSPDPDLSWLALARAWKGWSQRELAEESGVSQVQIARLESGKRQPRLTTARKLADALGVEVDRIFPAGGPTPVEYLAEYFEPDA